MSNLKALNISTYLYECTTYNILSAFCQRSMSEIELHCDTGMSLIKLRSKA